MKRLISFALVTTLTLAATLPAHAQPAPPKKRGGLLDGLGEGPAKPEGPSHTDGTQPTNPGGRPPPVVNPPPIATAPPPATKPPATDPALEAEIERTRKALDALRAKKPGELPTTMDAEKARAIIDKYKRAAEAMGTDVSSDDHARAERLKARDAAFHEKFDKHKEAITSGQRPDDMTPSQWARFCDEYYLERAKLEASMKAAERDLRERGQQPTEAAQKLEAAEKALQELEAANRRGSSADLIAKLHDARIALIAQRLRELEQLRAERQDKESGRDNASTASAFHREGDWYIDSLNWITRQMELMGRAGPPANSLSDGLPIPDWLERAHTLSAADKHKAKLRWLSRQMEALSQMMADAKANAEADDEIQLDRLRSDLEDADRLTDPRLQDEAKAAERERKVAELKETQDETRAARVNEERRSLRAELEAYAQSLAAENAALDELNKPNEGLPPPAPPR